MHSIPMNSWRFDADRIGGIGQALRKPYHQGAILKSIEIESNRKSISYHRKCRFCRSSALKYVIAPSMYVSSKAKRNLTVFLFWLLAFFLLTALGFAQTQSSQIGYKSAADAEQKKTLLLKDFKPVSMLHVPVHQVDRAKFYVIDVHNHVNDALRIDDHMPPERVIEIMNNTNVKTVVILTGMWGEKLQHVIDEMVKPYPGRFMVFAQIDWSKIDDRNFSQEMVAQVDDAVKRGARGCKVLKDLG